MDKRYQVFVSSTYTDLQEERQTVFQTLMEMDCIPAGMELFPASDEDQFEFIKKVIDDCDYYLLIIGGRYGSLAPDNMSYTEKEFDYAVQTGKKVVVLVHESPESIPAGKSEVAPELREKLEVFKSKAMSGRLVDFWSEPKDLAIKAAIALMKTIKRFPAKGWVRGDTVASEDILLQLQKMNKENELLKRQIANQNKDIFESIDNLAKFDSIYEVQIWDNHLEMLGSGDLSGLKFSKNITKIEITWREIFETIAPIAFSFGSVDSARNKLYSHVTNSEVSRAFIYSDALVNWDTIIIQLRAYGLMEIVSEFTGEQPETRIKLTKEGLKIYARSLVVYENENL